MTTMFWNDSHVKTEPQQQPLPTDSGQQILLVDHDCRVLESLSESLTRQGYNVATAADGVTALRMAACQPTDLIILDVCLPDGDGMDICAQLTDDPSTCGIPVIILSEVGDQNIVRQARNAGCSFFLRKPYDPNSLLVLIKAALRSAKDAWHCS